MVAHMSHLVLLLTWTTAGISFMVALWAQRRQYARQRLMPVSVPIGADVAQNKLDC